jgi:rhodanese-related sulfurtransferase
MPKRIDRSDVRDLLVEGAQLIEVLPHDVYEQEHIDGAMNIPLRELEARAPDELDSSRPVITYCSGAL